MRDGKKKAKTVAVTPAAAPPAADDPGPSMPAAPPPTRQNTMAVMPAELPEVSRREAAVSIASHRATNSTFSRWRTQDPIVAAVIERQLAYMEAVEKAAMAASAERARAREVRQQAIFDAALRVPKRADDPFRGPLPEWVDPDAPPPAAEAAISEAGSQDAASLWKAAGAKATAKSGGKAGKAGKGGKASGAKAGAKGSEKKEKPKKESTKLASLQYFRPGEKRKGVKGWIKELDARGWSKKKTALVPAHSRGCMNAPLSPFPPPAHAPPYGRRCACTACDA